MLLQLQNDLADEIKEICSDMLFKDPGGELEHIRTFCQSLPKREQTVKGEKDVKPGDLLQEEPEDEQDPYPYCVVRAESGNVMMGGQRVKVILIIGIFNDDTQNNGHREIINVISKITERFVKDPILKGRYRLDLEAGLSWILDDEDRFPYFAGGIEMTWETFFVEREDDYA